MKSTLKRGHLISHGSLTVGFQPKKSIIVLIHELKFNSHRKSHDCFKISHLFSVDFLRVTSPSPKTRRLLFLILSMCDRVLTFIPPMQIKRQHLLILSETQRVPCEFHFKIHKGDIRSLTLSPCSLIFFVFYTLSLMMSELCPLWK